MFVMRELSNNEKGAIAEAEIQAAAMKLGLGVYKPASGHSRADLIFELGAALWRVQVKWGRLSPARDVVIVHVGGSYLSAGGYVQSTYGEHEIDLLAVYCGPLDRCFLLPVSLVAGLGAIQLRLEPPRNNQSACIKLADDFAFEGAIAQLGERLNGIQEVVGSSPTSSTYTQDDLEPTLVGSNPFRDRLGYWMERVAAGQEVIVTFRGRPRVRLSPVISPP
jgi:hypothetical protein